MPRSVFGGIDSWRCHLVYLTLQRRRDRLRTSCIEEEMEEVGVAPLSLRFLIGQELSFRVPTVSLVAAIADTISVCSAISWSCCPRGGQAGLVLWR